MSPVLTASCWNGCFVVLVELVGDVVSNQCDHGNNDTLWHHKGPFFTPQNAFLGTHFLKSEATQEVRRTFPIPASLFIDGFGARITAKNANKKNHWLGGFSVMRDLSAPQWSEITRGYQMIIGHYSSPFRLRSACHLALVVMLMRGIPSLSLHAPCLTFMGLKSSEWWSASVWDSKLHRFNWEESSPWVCWEVPVGWPWTEQHVVHPYKKKRREKYGRTFLFMMQRLICLRTSHINLTSRFAKYCFTLLYAIFHHFIAYKHKPSQRANVLINIITKWS